MAQTRDQHRNAATVVVVLRPEGADKVALLESNRDFSGEYQISRKARYT